VLDGLSREQARARTSMFDVHGLLESTRNDLAEFQKPYAHQHAPTKDFVDAIESIKPTAIIGVSTVAKAFNQPVIEAMARINQRPIIFPYSNPTSRSECTAEEAYRWSEGRAVFASGSPFPPVRRVTGPWCRDKETMSTSFRLSEWRSMRRVLSESPMRCSSPPPTLSRSK
jgi:malate dehydrogenase (oxaloacetate-decarboxylating)(NADP+)